MKPGRGSSTPKTSSPQEFGRPIEVGSEFQTCASATRAAGVGHSNKPIASDYQRPETIEETAELVTSVGGNGVAVAVDPLDPAQVRELADRIRSDFGHLDVLVDDIWGGEVLECDLSGTVLAELRFRAGALPWLSCPTSSRGAVFFGATASGVSLAELFADILPPGVFNVVCGDRSTGAALTAHPIPANVSITGSTRAADDPSPLEGPLRDA
jgi:hypothetical protein